MPAAEEPLDPRLRRLLAVIVLGTFMSSLDMTIVNVAIDQLGDRLDSPLTTVQWVITGYTLALAAAVPVTGWLSRRLGTRNLYIATLVGFTACSALCGLAWSAGSLIAFRCLQGAFAGVLLPVGQMITTRAAGPQRIRRAMAVVGSVAVLAPIIGPVLGGLVIEGSSWRWAFLINIPIGVIATPLAFAMLPADKGVKGMRIDALGLVLLCTGMPAITFGVTRLGEGADPLAPGSLPVLALGVIAVGAFIVHALRVPNPLLELRLFENRTFAVSAALSTLLGAAVFGPYLLLPLFYQTTRGASPLEAGLLFAPQGVGAAAAIILVGRLGSHISGGSIAVVGTAIMTVFTIPFALVQQDTPAALLSVVLACRGFGIGLSMIPALSSALAVLRPEQVADASPQLNMLLRIGASIGTAVLSVILASYAIGAEGYQHTFVWVVVLCALCIPLALWLRVLERPAAAMVAETPAAG